ncbi:unnamed protein product [Rotaria sp. Silwood1]|nr:unnamed protein product [Rotaria sp. Silwood1]
MKLVVEIPAREEIEVRIFKQNIEPRVINETTAIAKIYDEELHRQQMPQTAAAIILSLYEANLALNCACRKMISIVLTSDVLDIPAQYQVTLSDKQILVYDKTSRYPCVVILLCDCKTRSYKELFRELKYHATRLKTAFNPDIITSDFEKALIKVVVDKCPQLRHAGYYFHFTQALYRNIQKLGLRIAYRNNKTKR